MMFDLTGLLHGNQTETIIIASGFLVYVVAVSFFAYRDTSSKEEKKDILAFLGVFGSLAAVVLIIAIVLTKWPLDNLAWIPSL